MLENFMHMNADEQHAVETRGLLEADPNGKRPNEAGAKLDAGKTDLGWCCADLRVHCKRWARLAPTVRPNTPTTGGLALRKASNAGGKPRE